MIFKLYVYKSRVSSTLNSNKFLHQMVKVKNVEKGAAFKNKQKHDMFFKKCSIILEKYLRGSFYLVKLPAFWLKLD